MSIKLYQLYCEICNWKKITDGSDMESQSLVEIKTAPIPTGQPQLEDSKELVTPPPRKQLRKFKCPNCGRLVHPRKIDDPQSRIDEKVEADKRAKERNEKDWSDGRKKGVERWKV